jgi:hypothetical protein
LIRYFLTSYRFKRENNGSFVTPLQRRVTMPITACHNLGENGFYILKKMLIIPDILFSKL